jgi:L-amino acid N-acyltransferase YncA
VDDISIRRATVADAGAIAAIYNHYVLNSTATFDTQPKTDEDREWWLSDRDPRHPVIVAERDGEVVGWAALGPYRERPAWVHTSEVAVYVADSQRGSGVGSRLLQALVDEGRGLGLHALVSQVVAGNDASIRMAERLGFERAGVLREVGRKFGTWLDVVILELVVARPEDPA